MWVPIGITSGEDTHRAATPCEGRRSARGGVPKVDCRGQRGVTVNRRLARLGLTCRTFATRAGSTGAMATPGASPAHAATTPIGSTIMLWAQETGPICPAPAM